MARISVNDVIAALDSTRISPTGVSFAGKSLKLNNEEDAKEVVEAIEKCSNLQFLNMEGNTLGVEASKGIAKALEKHPEFKRALWKDMFTGRMKEEIPKALEYLGDGLVKGSAKLVELDLSDNAFGPIGVQGLASLLRSSSCYALEELRLNNNGLGITGGKLLATALSDCYKSSAKAGKPLALKVFIAGRNRLENPGAIALSDVFKLIGTLEEIAMPQNGIYHPGITALSQSFEQNKNLQVINLNDNTIGPKGAEAIAQALPNLSKLKEINFGDCLLKTAGAVSLSKGLAVGHELLETVTLGFNEIKLNGGLELAKAMANKTKLKQLTLDGNQFGEKGMKEIIKKLREVGKDNVATFEDNESEDEDEEDDNEADKSEEDEESDQSNESETEDIKEVSLTISSRVSIEEFLKTPSALNFIALGEERDSLIKNNSKLTNQSDIDPFIQNLMKVASLCNNSKEPVSSSALKCTDLLYKELFSWGQRNEQLSIVNNSLLIHLGLIKSEDKKAKPTWNIEGCLKGLEFVLNKNYVPQSTKNTIKVFVQKEIDNNTNHTPLMKNILSILQ